MVRKMSLIGGLLAINAMAAVANEPAGPSGTPAQLYTRGYAAELSHRYSESIRWFDSCIAKDSLYAPAFVHKGQAEMCLGLYSAAYRDFRMAEDILHSSKVATESVKWSQPQWWTSNYGNDALDLNLARCMMSLGKNSEALSTVNNHAISGNFSALALALRALIYAKLDRFEDATKDIEALSNYKNYSVSWTPPDGGSIWHDLKRACLMVALHDKSPKIFSDDLIGKDPELIFARAEACYKLGLPAEAAATCQRDLATSVEVVGPANHNWAGRLYEYSKKYPEAAREYDLAIEPISIPWAPFATQSAELNVNRARLMLKMKDLKGCLDECKTALRIAGDRELGAAYQAHRISAQAYEALGDKAQAERERTAMDEMKLSDYQREDDYNFGADME